MARELDSEALARLQQSYAAMADAELLELAANPDDLTEMANEVLRGEMTRRHLTVEDPEPAGGVGVTGAAQELPTARRFDSGISTDPFAAATLRAQWGVPSEAGEARRGTASLMVFFDAIALSRVCHFLEEQEVEFEINDLSKPRAELQPFERPVEMELVVRPADKLRAMAVLREKMGLFPLQEVEAADKPEDSDWIMVASFGQREDAEAVARALQDAGIWRQVSENPDGAAESDDAFLVEVREADQEHALRVVEKAMGIAEE